MWVTLAQTVGIQMVINNRECMDLEFCQAEMPPPVAKSSIISYDRKARGRYMDARLEFLLTSLSI